MVSRRNEAASLAIILLTGAFSFAQTPANGTPPSDSGASGVHVLPVRANVYMLVGAGGNITLQTGTDGLVLVDTGLAEMADQTLSAIRTVSKDPIHFIINTDADPDHVGGNPAISKVGSTITDNNFLSDIAGSSVMPGAKIISHLRVLDRLPMSIHRRRRKSSSMERQWSSITNPRRIPMAIRSCFSDVPT